MNLQDLQLVTRPRRDWEAVDLGILMARRWWWPMVQMWLLLALPLTLITWVLPERWLWLSTLIIWWLKPALERPLLLILSRAVFGEELSTRAVLRQTPGLLRRQLFASLLWRRLSVSRSMDLPVTQLEGLKGAQRSARLQLLHRADAGPAMWLTILGCHIEALLLLGITLLGLSLIPEGLSFDHFEALAHASEDSRWGWFAYNLLYTFALALVAPWYLAGGFALYLNRRIQLESWDIEIAFKRMLQVRPKLTAAPHALILVILLGVTTLPAPSSQAVELADPTKPAQIEQIEAWQAEKTAAREQVAAILDSSTFQNQETIYIPRWKGEQKTSNPLPERFVNLLQTLSNWLQQLGRSGELLLWAAVLAGIILVAVRYRLWLARFNPKWLQRTQTAELPASLFGMAVSSQSLPENISASAWALWQQQRSREALALLYRASLNALLQQGLTLPPGATEGECLAEVRRQAQQLGLSAATQSYFAQLTEQWQQLAYGHLQLDGQRAEQLCRQWDSAWGEHSRAHSI